MDAGKAVHVGDDETADKAGANAIGLECWYVESFPVVGPFAMEISIFNHVKSFELFIGSLITMSFFFHDNF